MTFIEIYNRVISFWGDKVVFSDGILLLKNGFTSKIFSLQWNSVEKKVGHKDSFGELMVWTMYQVFNENARNLFIEGVTEFDPRTIQKNEIEKKYFENLNTESWEKELTQYERII